MENRQRYGILTTDTFIIGLTILLFNDFYLKYAYPGILTGKLSDFAGLFIFPIFISVFIPKPRTIYLVTGLLFTFWKLDYSQSFLDYVSRLTNLGFYRTVDPTDLITLIILPLSYSYLKSKDNVVHQHRLALSSFVSLISIFSFFATTLPRQTIKANIKVDKAFELPISKNDLFKQLNYGSGISDSLPRNLADTLFYLYFQIPDYSAEATAIAKIKSLGSNKTIIQLDSITEYNITGRLFGGIKQGNIDGCKNLKSMDFENIFESNYIDYLLQKKESDGELYFDKKELMDHR